MKGNEMLTERELRNSFSGISAKGIRELIVAHGKTAQTDSGPEYQACRCAFCEFGRKLLREMETV